jgi:hypothetical protein
MQEFIGSFQRIFQSSPAGGSDSSVFDPAFSTTQSAMKTQMSGAYGRPAGGGQSSEGEDSIPQMLKGANATFEKVFGFKREELDARNYWELGWSQLNPETHQNMVRTTTTNLNAYYGTSGLSVAEIAERLAAPYSAGDGAVRPNTISPWFDNPYEPELPMDIEMLKANNPGISGEMIDKWNEERIHSAQQERSQWGALYQEAAEVARGGGERGPGNELMGARMIEQIRSKQRENGGVKPAKTPIILSSGDLFQGS